VKALLLHLLCLMTKGFHELAAPQDALVRNVGLPSPAERLHGLPAADAAEQSPALKVGPPSLGHACRHEGPVQLAGAPPGRTKLRQHHRRCLPWNIAHSTESRVAAVGVFGKCTEIGDYPGAERIQVNIADELQKVRLLLDDDRLVPVLEKVPCAFVAAVEGSGVTSEQAPHAPRQGASACPDEEVKVIGEERPGIDSEGPGVGQGGEAANEVVAVLVIAEDDLAVQAPAHHVMENAGGIETGSAGHSGQESTRK